MEINAEINKVFGEQMATLFASKIPEEQIEEMSRKAWTDITSRPYRYGTESKSRLEELIQKAIETRILDKVNEILKEPKAEEETRAEAERIVKEAKEKSHQLVVDTIARNMVNGMMFNYANEIADGCNQITSAIFSIRS